jgi:hypothetical protein
MEMHCECSATATGSAQLTTLIDRFPSSGLLTVSAEICLQDCSPHGSFINITYKDNNNARNNFEFHSTVVGLPAFHPVSGGGQAMVASAQGQAIGENFTGEAILSNIHFFQETIIGTVTCSIYLTANHHTFEVGGCFNSIIEIKPLR